MTGATVLDTTTMRPLLERWAAERYGSGARVHDVAPMPGNAGLSFGFRVTGPGGSWWRLVVRLSPPGVRRSGNTDVLRQVPLLETLAGAGVPVAPIVWWTDDPEWFGTDAIVQPYLDAVPLPMHGGERVDAAGHLEQAARALAQVHAVDPAPLSSWDDERTTAGEVAFWGRLLDRSPRPEWVEQGRRVGEALVAHDPGGHRIGVFHGDYQTHNVLYDSEGLLAAVIDWEIAGIGPVGQDVGWLAMMVDPECWHPERRAVLSTVADPHDVLGWYEAAAGAPLPDFDWHRAYSCFRYGAIAAFNLYLHESGRRPDETSALMGGGVPALFGRAELLLDGSP